MRVVQIDVEIDDATPLEVDALDRMVRATRGALDPTVQVQTTGSDGVHYMPSSERLRFKVAVLTPPDGNLADLRSFVQRLLDLDGVR